MIKRILKSVVKWMARCMMTPFRKSYKRRNGVCDTSMRKELPNEVLLGLASQSLAEGHTVTIWVKGYSMRPFIEHERDRVFLERSEELHVGDAVLAQIAPNKYVLHRIIHLSGDHVVLQGDGNLRGVEHCLRSDVCGTVRQYIRPNRTIPADDPKLVRRIRRWRKWRRFRRVLLLFYKATLPAK